MTDHEQFMSRAIAVAGNNPSAPFGAILVEIDSQTIVAEGFNRTRDNPLLHGEIDVMNRYAESGDGNWRGLQLYTTAEPCCMCQAAIIWAGISKVVFGTSIGTLTSLGWRQFQLSAQQVTDASFSDCEIIGGILEAECDEIFRKARGS